MDENESIRAFWDWFCRNSEQLRQVRSADADIFCELDCRIKRVDPNIGVEIGGSVYVEELELVLTAYGDVDRFELVDRIAAASPQATGWRVRALKPPVLDELTAVFESQEVSTADIWVKPISDLGSQELIHVLVAIPQSEDEFNENRKLAALLAIESFLGERIYALRVSIEGFSSLPITPTESGFVRLQDVAYMLGVTKLQ